LPLSRFLEADGTAITLVDGQCRGTELSFLIFNTDFVNKNADATIRFVAAYLKAQSYVESKGWGDTQVQSIVEKYTKLPGTFRRRCYFEAMLAL